MSALTCAVVIATAGRPTLAAEVMADLAAQTRPFDAKVISVPGAASLPEDVSGWQVVYSTGGLSAQRNAGLHAVDPVADVVFFFDDDSTVRHDYVARAMRWFETQPDLLGLHGTVLADGAVSGEISRPDAQARLARSWDEPVVERLDASRTLYGCNMVIRRRPPDDIYFDERLPAYSWLEDHDLARRLGSAGRLASATDCLIVHRAAKSGGRANHLRLGYSQVMNPAYLHRKGSFPLWLTAWEIFRPSVKNVLKSFAGPERSWRRIRLKGNRLAWSDVVRGRYTPERILSL